MILQYINQMSWLTTRILLFTRGPSTETVRLGASLTSREIFSFDGRRWYSDVAIIGSNSSVHPPNQSSALISPRFSVSLSSILIDHEPDGDTTPEMLLLPM